MSLPSLEEFKETVKFEQEDMKDMWDKELFKCPQCNGGVKRDYSMAFMSNPPKFRYFCRNCNWTAIF